MESLKPLSLKQAKKSDREKKVLLGLVDLYIQEGKPIGSNTLKDSDFQDISSATIRNYFTKLEKDGYLIQQHASGGRIPTQKAYHLYAQEFEPTQPLISKKDRDWLQELKTQELKEVGAILQGSLHELSTATKTACFLSYPRFDQDSIICIKLVSADVNRSICVLMTNFGLIHTEILYSQQKLSSFALNRIENYFKMRLFGSPCLEKLSDFEQDIADRFFNEVLIRYLVHHANYSKEDYYSSGVSNLLAYFEFDQAKSLAKGLSIIEHPHALGKIFNQILNQNQMSYWIGTDLNQFDCYAEECAMIGFPYYVNQTAVGSIALLGPQRLPYHHLFAIVKEYSKNLSWALTKSVFKYQISFRRPHPNTMHLQDQSDSGTNKLILLENKHNNEK